MGALPKHHHHVRRPGWTYLRKGLLWAVVMTSLFCFSGCSQRQPDSRNSAPALPPSAVGEQNLPTRTVPDAALAKEPEPQATQPRFKELSPLDVERISISFVDTGYRDVFRVLARAAGLNLVFANDLDDLVARKTLTAEYQEMHIRPILDAVCRILDLSWHEELGTLFIEAFRQEVIHLDFLGQIQTSNFGVGGDVLGGGESGGAGGDSSAIVAPLTGRYEISGETSDKVTDIYGNIDETVGERIGDGGSYFLNRQTGTLFVRSRPSRIREIRQFLDTLRERYGRQVLIEAKIIEISLDRGHQFGVDWRHFAIHAATNPIQSVAENILDIQGNQAGNDSFFNLRLQSEYYTMSGVFRALQEYGSLKVLSNPRLKAMNGQAAMISVGQSVSYLRSLKKTTQGQGDNSTTDISTEIGAVFDGILLGVTPIIRDNDTVLLHIVPIKSDLMELDQQQLGTDGSLQVTFPKVNLREISTVVQARSGDMVVLGGLIMEHVQEGEEGLPLLGSIPILGYLFKQEKKETRRVELVVILQVKIRS